MKSINTNALQCRAVATLSAALVLAGGAQAATIALDTGSLPSTQGWVYVAAGDGAGVAESAVFSVGGGELHQNSLGIGMAHAGGNWYQHAVTLAPGQSWAMTMVARLFSFESIKSPNYPFGLFFGANNDSAVGFGADNIQYVVATGLALAALPVGFDSSIYNSYEYTFSGGLQAFSINGVMVFEGEPTPAATPGAILFGDGTGYANARADIRSFTFTSSVPEPGTLPMLLAGAGILGFIGRRCRR